MHVTTIEEKLQLYLSDADATWSDADTALWNDGALRMLVVHRGAGLSAAALVDAQLRRAPGAQLVVAHEGDATDVARRTAERFGITLLDARALAAPEPEAIPVEPPALFVDTEAALVPAPALFVEADAALVALPAPAPLVVDAPPLAPAAAQPFPLPPRGFFAALERPVVVPQFPLPASARFFETLETPAVVPGFPEPASTFFAALERPEVVLDFPVPDASLVRALDRPYEAPAFPTPEEGFFAAFDELLAAAPAASPEPLFPPVAEGLLDALDMTLVQQALESAALEAEMLPAPTETARVEAAPAVDAPLIALPFLEPATIDAPAPDAPWPVFEDALLPPAPVVEASVPWAADPLTADANEDEPAVAVTAEEVAAMPWSIEEATPTTPRAFTPHPSEVMPASPAWGLPWPRPVAQNDGLRVVDAAKWDPRGALAPPQAPPMPLVPPQHANSAWLRRLQSFGGP